MYLLLAAHLLVLAALATSTVASVAAPSTFVLAFHVSVRVGDEPFVRRFLSRIYHPSNVYLVEFGYDLDLPTNLASELPGGGENIHVRTADAAVPGGISEVLRSLSAMSFFVDLEDFSGKKFHYYINTSPRDYPVVSPENARTLLAWAYAAHNPPLNFFRFAPEDEWAQYAARYEQLHYDPSLVFAEMDGELANVFSETVWNPDRASRKRKVAKVDANMIVSGDFVRVCTDSMLSKKLLAVFSDSELAAEHFFGTLAHDLAASAGNTLSTTALRCDDLNTLLDVRLRNLNSSERRPVFSDYMQRMAAKGAVTMESHGCLFVSLMPNRDISTRAAQDLIDSAVLDGQGSFHSDDESIHLQTLRKLIEREISNILDRLDKGTRVSGLGRDDFSMLTL
jgi:hypothetical protein